jgi:hypothetical protein
LAAQELDKLWDSSMATMSASYEKALDRLSAGDVSQASIGFRTEYVPAIKKLFTEAEKTYPTRFAAIDDWCAWIKEFYTLSIKADKSLSSGDGKLAAEQLAGLRDHVCKLHRQTATAKVNDLIHVFRSAASRDKPDVSELRELRDEVKSAEPSVKAKADPAAFEQALKAWSEQVDVILKAEQLDAAAMAKLREATETFYRAYGVQFE